MDKRSTFSTFLILVTRQLAHLAAFEADIATPRLEQLQPLHVSIHIRQVYTHNIHNNPQSILTTARDFAALLMNSIARACWKSMGVCSTRELPGHREGVCPRKLNTLLHTSFNKWQLQNLFLLTDIFHSNAFQPHLTRRWEQIEWRVCVVFLTHTHTHEKKTNFNKNTTCGWLYGNYQCKSLYWQLLLHQNRFCSLQIECSCM